MREILFKAKRLDNGEWVYWNKFGEYTEPFISEIDIHSHVSEYEVDPETLGQYTGLTDKNGVKIFEGDVIAYTKRATATLDMTVYGTVFYDVTAGAFCVEQQFVSNAPLLADIKCEVIGSIHDNPEVTE